MKVGIDIHGVIDKAPSTFACITRLLIEDGHEVHILTGMERTDALVEQLKSYGVVWTNLFSITSHHKEIGTRMSYKNGDPTQPLISPVVWDRTKAEYCLKHDIDVHIDDSTEYGFYFKDIRTQYIIYSPAMDDLLKCVVIFPGPAVAC